MSPIIWMGKEICIEPIALSIGNIKIYWYGIIIVSAIMLSLFLINKRKNTYNIEKDTIFDFLFWGLIVGFASARIYYVIFKAEYYLNNITEIFMIWHGGLAIYGGIIGTVIYGIIFCKKKKISFLDLADLLLPYLALSQSVGRWGNFVNREAYGYETNLPWKMGIFNNETLRYMYVHPTFLYESICTFLIFIILLIKSKNRKFSGEILLLYCFLYGITRSIVEGMRTDSLMIADFRVSQLISVIIVISSAIIYITRKCSRTNEQK